MDMVAVVVAGATWDDAVRMHPLERRAFLYAVATINGNKVNWETGGIIKGE